MGKFRNIVFQVNGGPWKSILAEKAWEVESLSDLPISVLVDQGVTFGALDHYDSKGKYSNIKFKVELV